MKEILIGIDNGNKFTKTHNELFLEETSIRPISDDYIAFGKTIIKYNNSLYVIGEGRNSVKLNKFEDEDTFLITIAGIAEELHAKGINEKVDIILGVGLPLMSYGKYKLMMKEYFLRDNIEVEYKNKQYYFNIKEVYVYPQGIAGFMTVYHRYKDFQVCNIIDLGGYTLDIFKTGEGGIPELSSLKSYTTGVITLFEDIKQELLKNDITLNDKQIEKIIANEDSFIIDNKCISIINTKADQYVKELINKLKESGMELKNPCIFIGGGFNLLENHIRSSKEFNYVEFLDIYANAKGYYKLASEQRNKLKLRK